MMVSERFTLAPEHIAILRQLRPRFGFGSFGEATYYRTYSRIGNDGKRETWSDTVVRVIEGVFSVRKNHHRQNDLEWDDAYYQSYAFKMAQTMFAMHWLPPGRGLWAMGTEYVYERGSAALCNCGAVDTTDLAEAVDWCMDMLMCGVGVGFNTAWQGEARRPDKSSPDLYVIDDSREGWIRSVRLLVESYTDQGRWYAFDYSRIRPAGSPIRGFGGTASGPEPLKKLHERLEHTLDGYCEGVFDKTRCIADIFNAIGVCVVAGNVRRSAQIALGSGYDETFLNLKNYEMHPERSAIGWVSNNTVILETPDDFQLLPRIVRHIRNNGEPGLINLANIRKYGRFGEEKADAAQLCNPCGEIALESYELCNLSEVFPTRCPDEESFFEALEFATFYASTVALLPTHRSKTNEILVRNRRIGVSLSGLAEWIETIGKDRCVQTLREGYRIVRDINRALASKARVHESIRITTVKPSGTLSLLAGVSSGIHFPLSKYTLRRMRVGGDTTFERFLKHVGVPNEPDRLEPHTTVFEFPVRFAADRTLDEVSAHEQFEFLALLQREWSDNMVSCTVSFDSRMSERELEQLLIAFLPRIKSVSMLPHTPRGTYVQMPFEAITQEEYAARRAVFPIIDWTKLTQWEGESESFCGTERCSIEKFGEI